jgi:hypothetical protein
LPLTPSRPGKIYYKDGKFQEIIGIDDENKLTVQVGGCKVFRDEARSENDWLINVIIQFVKIQKDRVNRNCWLKPFANI